MKIYFSGVGEARNIATIIEHPVCPRVDEDIQFGDEDAEGSSNWTVRVVQHMIATADYDVYCVVGPPRH